MLNTLVASQTLHLQAEVQGLNDIVGLLSNLFFLLLHSSSPVVSQDLAFAQLVLHHYSDLSSVSPSREASPNGPM